MDSNSPLLQQVLNGESEQDKTHEARAIILCSHDETDSALIRPPKLGPKPDLESFEEVSEHNSEEEISQMLVELCHNGSMQTRNSQSEAASTFSFTFHALFNHKNFCKASKYTIISLCLNLAPITIYLFDFVTDWVNGFSYWNRREENKDNIFYFALTIFVIVLPAVVMHIFSACWEFEANEDKKKQENKTAGGCCFFFSMALMHILQIGPVYRYVRAAYYGLKSTSHKADLQPALHDHFYRKCHAELADVDFLRMVESFLEAGPQLVLQIYIMVTTLQTPFITVLSCCVSLFGMSTSPVAYERALRIAVQDKVQLSIIGTIVMFLYRVCNITSRVFALALLLNLHFWIWISLFVFHWFLMTLMILQQNTKFCPTKAKECFYNVIIGFFYTFDYFNVQNGNSNKRKLGFYYSITFIEDVVIVISWYFFRHGGSLLDYVMGTTSTTSSNEQVNSTVLPELVPNHGTVQDQIALMLVLVTMGAYLLGVIFLILYYTVFHPSTASKYNIQDFFHWKRHIKRLKNKQVPEEKPNNSTGEIKPRDMVVVCHESAV